MPEKPRRSSAVLSPEEVRPPRFTQANKSSRGQYPEKPRRSSAVPFPEEARPPRFTQAHKLSLPGDRKKKTVKKFLKTIPKRLRKNLGGVCSDMYDGFINAAKEVFGKRVIIIADRFHVAKLYRKDFDGFRRNEMNRLKKELSEEEYGKLKGAMWALRKKEDRLSDEEKEILNCLFGYSPELKLAYDFCNELTDIFEEDICKSDAEREIRIWKIRVGASGLKCFDSFLKTLGKRYREITNYFISRQTSGFVEGLNNKIKVIKRRCYGITNTDNLFRRIFLDIRGYSLFAGLH
ncbi:ISL3 family transposase [Desulfococcaceae bacterium HSG8]|nr:ISL3 family transposase [Desulfococcaceae bacterium HSG8]